MKTIAIILLYTLIILNSCSRKSDIPELNTKQNVIDAIDTLLTKEVQKEPVHEIYLHAFSSEWYSILLYSGQKSLISKNISPVAKTQISHTTFYIYSGIEKYFTVLPEDTVALNDYIVTKPSKGYFWLIRPDLETLKFKVVSFSSFTPYSDEFYMMHLKKTIIKYNNPQNKHLK